MSHFLGELADSILGEESGFLFGTEEEIQEELREDFERNHALQGLLRDIHSGATFTLNEFDGDEDFVTVESEEALPPWSTNSYIYDDEDVVIHQQNRAEAYALAAQATYQEQRNTTPPRVNWKKEGF